MRLFVRTAALLCLSATATQAIEISDTQPPLWPRQIQQIKAFMAGNAGNAADELSQTLATFGRDDLAAKLRRPKDGVCQPLMRGGKPVSPLPFITKSAAKTRAVIINETHDAPQDRAFIMDLGHALHSEGYSLYGAETFTSVPELHVSTDGHTRSVKRISLAPETGPLWPMRFYGVFVQEPTFGELLRGLRRDGYRFFAYDAPPDGMQKPSPQQRTNAHEKQAMANVAAKLKAEPKNTKVLLHVGYAHAFERPGSDDKKWLAQRFRAATGIDPLTISQTDYAAPGADYVICDPQKLKDKPRTDITLGTPRETFRRGRPLWRLKRGEHFFDVPEKLRRPDQIAVYRAMYANEPDGAVAADQLLLRPGDKLPLLLPAGKFRLTVWTERDGWSRPVLIQVRG